MIEHWLADPMNLGLILCASMWFAFAYNLVLGTFEGMPWTRERRVGFHRPRPNAPPPLRPKFGGISAEEATRNLTAFIDGDVSKPVAVMKSLKYRLDIGPEFHDLGTVTKADVAALLNSIDRDLLWPLLKSDSGLPPRDSAGPKSIWE